MRIYVGSPRRCPTLSSTVGLIWVHTPLGSAQGTRLGPCEIVAPVGAGGIGEVYRARDTRLDRTVAIKGVPSHLSADAPDRGRFKREAHTPPTTMKSTPWALRAHSMAR